MAIFNGFDGINCRIDMSPREVKILYLALDQLKEEDHEAIAKALNIDGFSLTAKDAFATTRSLQLSVQGLASGIKGDKSAGIEKAKEDAAKPKTSLTVN